MQTFLPYEDFKASAEVLDDDRLCKQLNEGFVILKSCISPLGGWPHHSVTRQWRGHEMTLWDYMHAIKSEMESRDTVSPGRGFDIWERITDLSFEIFDLTRTAHSTTPVWLGDPMFHAAHRGNLVRKGEPYKSLWPMQEPMESIQIKSAVEAAIGHELTTDWEIWRRR